MDPSLVGSQMSSDTSSDQSSVRDGAGYDEVLAQVKSPTAFLSRQEKKRQLSPLVLT